MRQIYGATLSRARLLRDDISQRELARRAATELQRPSAAAAFQKAISRIELKQEPCGLPGDLVGALELELGLELGDLSHPYWWVYSLTCAAGSDDRPAWLGGRLPVFLSACEAHEARGWVTFGEGRVIRELELAHPHEIFYGELNRTVGGNWSLAAIDPAYQEFMQLAGLPPRSEP